MRLFSIDKSYQNETQKKYHKLNMSYLVIPKFTQTKRVRQVLSFPYFVFVRHSEMLHA